MGTPGWSPTDSMTTSRSNATITLLSNGNVLIAGGKAGLGALPVLSSAEMYNPELGTWSGTGSMALPRQIATATRLTDGRVLVAGGRTGTGLATATAEIYNPAVGTWSGTGAMTTPRVRHSAALLPDGRVIVGGGLDDTAQGLGQVVLKSAEIYDPANGTWTPAESLSINRYGFPLVALHDGRLLAIGGASSAGDAVFNASAEIFDASTLHWTMTHDMSEGRGFFPATVLTDGRVLVAGGSIHDGSLLGNVQTGSAEIYDPATGRWSRTGDLAVRRMGARAATLPDGRVIVAGGSLYDIVGNGINLSIVDREVLASSEIWDLYTGVWNPGDNMSESRTSFMLAKLLNGAVLATGGNGLDGIARSSANLFK